MTDITVYLPDAVATRAKTEGINLSRTLRDSLEARWLAVGHFAAARCGKPGVTALDAEPGSSVS